MKDSRFKIQKRYLFRLNTRIGNKINSKPNNILESIDDSHWLRFSASNPLYTGLNVMFSMNVVINACVFDRNNVIDMLIRSDRL